MVTSSSTAAARYSSWVITPSDFTSASSAVLSAASVSSAVSSAAVVSSAITAVGNANVRESAISNTSLFFIVSPFWVRKFRCLTR